MELGVCDREDGDMNGLEEGVGEAVDLQPQGQRSAGHLKRGDWLTLKSRNRRSLPAVNRTGTVGEGWNLTELTSASDFPAWLASRRPMMSRVVGGRSRGRSEVSMISVVECRRFSTASSESDWKDSSDAFDSRLRFLRGSWSFSRAETAQDGVGLIRSYLEHGVNQGRP